jgi:hypothetical protein
MRFLEVGPAVLDLSFLVSVSDQVYVLLLQFVVVLVPSLQSVFILACFDFLFEVSCGPPLVFHIADLGNRSLQSHYQTRMLQYLLFH